MSGEEEVVGAIQDLSRIILAFQGEFSSKSEMIRKLHDMSIPSNRIARLLGMQLKDVTSAISKMKKAGKKGKKGLEKKQPVGDVVQINKEESASSS